MPSDLLFRAFYALGFGALALAIVAGVYAALDDWREHRGEAGDGQD